MARRVDLEKTLGRSDMSIAYDRLICPAAERAVYRNSALTREANLLDLQRAFGVKMLRAYAVTDDNSDQEKGIYLEWIGEGVKTVARVGPIPVHCRRKGAFGFEMPVDNEQALIETCRV